MTAGSSTEYGAEEPHADQELPKMSFLDHLEELRKRLLYSFLAVFAGFLICWSVADELFELLQLPLAQYLPPGDSLAYTRLTAPFFLYMKVAFFAGLFLAAPVVLWQIWMFISPGLYRRERRYALPFIFFGALFFIAGGYFGYRYLLPTTCQFFVETGKNFKQVVTVDDYFGFASLIILAAGIVFETPIFVFFLARIGIVTPAFLMQKFKYAVVGAFIFAAVITPTPDMVTQLALAIPMILLYLLGVGVAYVFAKPVE
ncbi:MAG TPA: twin-arginine translocase subunit TatC [Thermoanaerobaculia bacterium]|nr:twin-arginine translocase subunit TatC [Thermoanaerobaculia bacterium]